MDHDGATSATDSCEESASEELYHDTIDVKKDNRHFSDDSHNIGNNGTQIKSKSRTDLVFDLRDVPTIANPAKSDDETSEKLSAVIEQPEEQVKSENARNYETESLVRPELDEILSERINTLQRGIIELRGEMTLALSLWRKERDEFLLLREKKDILALEEANAAARAAAEAYAAESPLSNDIGNSVDLNPVQSLSELAILEYEKKLAKYQDALALAQAEKRYNMRRKMIANTYRQRLNEVERMCDEELEKIRATANVLQPLRQMASQWYATPRDGARSDSNPEWKFSSCKTEKEIEEVTERYNRERAKGAFVDDEVNMTPEVIAARFSYTETSKYERNIAMGSSLKATQNHLLVESNSLPSTWYGSTANSVLRNRAT